MLKKSFKGVTGLLTALQYMAGSFGKVYLIMLMSVILSACGTTTSMEGKTSEAVVDTDEAGESDANKIVIKDTEDTIKPQNTFADPFADGTLNYTIRDCMVYKNLSEAGIDADKLMEPHNVYYSQDIGEQYQTIEDFVTEDGKIVDSHELIVLNVEIQNENAVGMIKKNEFSVSNIALRGGENVSQYNVAYFSQAGIVDKEEPLCYQLEKGKSMEIQLAYLVLKEDVENIVGVISDSDVQFFIN